MSASYLTDPVIFLIDSLCSLYILAIMLRFLLQWVRADFYNPVSQFLVKITHPPLKLLRRYVPPIGKIDTSALVLALTLQMASDYLILMLKGMGISFGALTILGASELIAMLLDIFIYAVFARAILSRLNPGSFGSLSSMLTSLTEPLLDTCRKFVPDLGGIDISPLAALLLLQLAKMVILPPFQQLASLIG